MAHLTFSSTLYFCLIFRAPSKYAKELNEIFQFVLTQELDGEPFSGWGLIALTICSAFVIKVGQSMGFQALLGEVSILVYGYKQDSSFLVTRIPKIYPVVVEYKGIQVVNRTPSPCFFSPKR